MAFPYAAFDRTYPMSLIDPGLPPFERPNKPPNHSIRSINWNPFGNLVATGSTDKTLRVCKFTVAPRAPALQTSPRLLIPLQGNPERPNIRFSTELRGHNAPIEKVAFNPIKEAELCSVSNDGTVKFWDVRTKNCVNEVKGLGEAFTLAWDPEGESLIVGNKVSHLPGPRASPRPKSRH